MRRLEGQRYQWSHGQKRGSSAWNRDLEGKFRECGYRALSPGRSERESAGSFSGSVLWSPPHWVVLKENDSDAPQRMKGRLQSRHTSAVRALQEGRERSSFPHTRTSRCLQLRSGVEVGGWEIIEK